MRIDFVQGIIAYPFSGSQQTFLVKTGSYVSLQAQNSRVDVAFAHGDTNYLLTESQNLSNVWGPIPSSTECWLYWDINTNTAVRTFGFTTIEPTYGPTVPPSPVEGLHWFDTANHIMYAYESGSFRERIRCFAGTVINSTFSGLGVGFPLTPFAGSQVGIYTTNTLVGRIVIDDDGLPIRRQTGEFFTTEDQFFVSGTSVTALKLEASVLTGVANETMAKYQIVKYAQFGRLNLANYEDVQEEAIAILLEDLVWDETGSVCIQGVITNPNWSWPTVGVPLYVTTAGQLSPSDPHLTDPLTYPISRPAVGRVLAPTQIYFDQGLGGRGDKGEPGDANNTYASPSVAGVTRLSVNAVDAGFPIAAGTNDPRVVNAVSRTGDTMTGLLVLSGDPTQALNAATKQYVDNRILNDISDVTITSAVNGQALVYNGSQWINALIANSTNLSPTVTATTVTINSDTGTDAIIPAATTSDAGAMTAADKSKLNGIAVGATANSSDATLLNRTNHTGTQLASTIGDFSEAVDDRVSALLVQGTNVTITYNDVANTLTVDAVTGSTNLSPVVNATTVTINSDTGTDAIIPAATTSDAGVMTAADKSKLDSIAAGATVNSSDAFLLTRTNHTGTQPATTISDFAEAVDDRVSALLVQGTNVTITYNDVANTLTIDSTTQAGTTNLSPTVAASTVTINSDTGTDATIPAATTSDAGVMTAADKSKLNGIAAGATANSSDAFLLARTNHTSTQALATIGDVTIAATDLNILDDGANTTLHFHDADRARANHTGTQSAATISDFAEAVDDRVNALLVQGSNITFTYNDVANTLTIAATAPAPAMTATHIGYGDGSNLLTGTSNFIWTNATQTLRLGSGTGPSRIFTANAVSGAGASSLTIQTGDANSGVVGAGLLSIQGGAGAGASAGGSIAIGAGANPSTGPGGSITIFAGTSASGTAGNIVFQTAGLDRITLSNTGAVTFSGAITLSSSLGGTSAAFSSTLSATSGTFSSTIEGTSLRVTGTTAPDNGMYLQAAGVVGLAANSVAAYKYGSNAFLSQTANTRDLGELAVPWRDIFSQNAVTVTSDARSKIDVKTNTLGLNFIKALRPVSYKQAIRTNLVEVLDDEQRTIVVTPVSGKRRHHGFLAHEVKIALDTLGLSATDFAGWVLSDPENPESLQALRYDEFIAPVVSAIQEQDAEITSLSIRLQQQDAEITSLKALVSSLILTTKGSKT